MLAESYTDILPDLIVESVGLWRTRGLIVGNVDGPMSLAGSATRPIPNSKMPQHFSDEQRRLIIRTYYANGQSARACRHALHGMCDPVPTERTIYRLVEKLQTTGTVSDVPYVRQRSGRSDENIAAVGASVQARPETSVRRRSQQLDSRTPQPNGFYDQIWQYIRIRSC